MVDFYCSLVNCFHFNGYLLLKKSWFIQLSTIFLVVYFLISVVCYSQFPECVFFAPHFDISLRVGLLVSFESWSYKSFLFNILLQTSEGSFVKKSAASMLSGKRTAPAAVNFFYLFLLYFLSFILNFAQIDIITMCYCSFVRLLTKRQCLLNQGLARKEMVLGGQNLQEHLNHLRTLR